MKVLFINPRMCELSPNIWVPLGIAYVAATLERDGHVIKILDLNAEKISNEDFRKELNNDIDVVGITGMIPEYQKILELVEIVKKTMYDVKVILGGPLATTLPEELLKQSQADFIVIGEGEKTTSDLLHTIENGLEIKNVRGIAYKNNGHIIFTERESQIENLDSIPFPARHLLNMEKYLKDHFKSMNINIENSIKVKSTNMISSRGCPYNCTFCFKGMWGNKWRARSVENLVEEMEILKNKYGINGYFFNDDTFVLRRKRVFEFTNLIKERNLDLFWYCNGRANLMQKDMLDAMYKTGCRGIAYGIESGNQRILNSMDKSITLDHVRRAVKWTKESNISVTGYFMIGMLGETKETIRETINFARELDLNFYGFSITTPFPGTVLYNEAVNKKKIQKDVNCVGSFKGWNFNVNANLTEDCTDEDLVNFKNEIFKEFTLKKEFGKYYFLNPTFQKEIFKIILSLRNSNEVKEFIRNAINIFY